MDKSIVNETRNGNTRTIEYSDGSTLTRTFNQGVAGFSDDNIVEVLSYPNGTQEKVEYRTTGTGMLFGEASGPYPFEVKKAHSDGTTEITSYKYNGEAGVGDQIATTQKYDKDGQFVGSEIVTRQSAGNYKKYEDGRFGGYQDVHNESFDANGRLVEKTTYDGSYELYGGAHTTISDHLEYDVKTKETYTYDDVGNVVSTKTYDKDGNLVSNEVASEMTFGGKVYTFNAGELRSIINSLSSTKESMKSEIDNIASRCNSMASAISSSDSGISSALNKVNQTCSKCKQLVDNLITNLCSNIESYINKTVSNEETQQSSLDSINNSLNDISGVFDGIGQ